MADVAIDPQNSNPKDLFGQGVRAYILQDFDVAVRAFSKTSELLAIEHGSETHDSLGDVYLYYGKSLLELSRRESGPLGEGVLKNVEEESEEDIGESEGEDGTKAEDDENTTKQDENKTDDQKTEEVKDECDKKAELKKTEADEEPEEEAKKGEEEKEGETDEVDKEEATKSTESKEGDEAEEDLSDLQVAWEVLELAKRIFTIRGADGQKNLAETLIILGEISLESGNFPSAIEDMVQGLQIQKKLFGNDSRTIAETYYKLGGAYSTNAQIDEAVESFNASLEYLKNKVNTLKKDEEHKEANAEEIQELENLIPEVQEKIADMKNLKTEIANKVAVSTDKTASKTNGTSEASSSKQVNDISHLVKRKRKDEEVEESTQENPAKRPSP